MTTIATSAPPFGSGGIGPKQFDRPMRDPGDKVVRHPIYPLKRIRKKDVKSELRAHKSWLRSLDRKYAKVAPKSSITPAQKQEYARDASRAYRRMA